MAEEDGGQGILLEKNGRIVKITLNRPEKRNAMSSWMQAQLRDALDACYGDVSVIILAANGPVFCAGIDLAEAKERKAKGIAAPRNYANGRDSWAATCYAIYEHPACVIAKVTGFAVGGGLSLVDSCDLAIASEKAEFMMTEMGFGSFPALVAPLTGKCINRKRLAQLVMTHERIDAQEAYMWGLVNKVVPDSELDAAVDAWANRIAQIDPYLLDYGKHAVNTIMRMDYETAMHYGGLINPAAKAAGAAHSDPTGFLQRKPGRGQGGQRKQ